jgi:hypothetical protein
MNSIHPDILANFDNMMKMRQVPIVDHSHYRKWLRYFLDFQARYLQSEERSVQIRMFSEKLRSKGQTEAQVRQAADAVSLFFTTQQKRPVASSPAATADVPGKARHGVPEQSLGQDSLTMSVVKELVMVCEPPGLPEPEGHGKRRKGRFDDWRCLRRTSYPAWDAIIVLLADEIKARHYSRKTLQHYANWTRKRSATPSPRIFCRPITTSARSRPCWVMRTYGRR